MKKILSVLLAIVAVCTFAITGFAAEATTVTVSEAEGERGDVVELSFVIKNNPGIASFDLTVNYDKSVLELKEFTVGSVLSSAICAPNVEDDLIAMMSMNDIVSDGTLFTAKFVIKDNAVAGETVVTVSGNMYNVSTNVVEYSAISGGVTVNVPCQHTDTKIINAKEATCCEKGYTGDTYCNECKTVIAEGTEIAKNADNHVGGTEVKNAKEATCSEKGYTGDTYCKGCGAVVAKGSETAKDSSNHVGGTEVKNAKEATCSEKGYTGDTCCKGCGAVVEKGSETAKNADNHVGGTEVKNAKEATCTEKGYTGDTHCKGCGVKLESGEEIAMLNHKGGKATCAEKAKCEVCGNEYGEVDADAHALKYETVKEPTCTEKGERKITCENGCGYEKSEEIEALGHDWGEWVTVKEATYDEKGLEERTCERTGCGEKETKETDKLVKPSEPQNPSNPSKPNPGVTEINPNEKDETNPDTGAAIRYGSVAGAAIILAAVVVISKNNKK